MNADQREAWRKALAAKAAASRQPGEDLEPTPGGTAHRAGAGGGPAVSYT